MSEPIPLTITEFTNKIKDTLYINFSTSVNIQGEISNLKYSNSHSYFTLKDDNSSINIIVWSTRINNSNGENVIVSGKINVYNKSGTYNIIANKIKLVGLGDIHKEYEERKKKFFEKGFFDDSKKKKIKYNIESIGIVTACEGAAIKDVLYVLKKHNFIGKVIIKNCKVQGENCSTSICEGIDYFAKKNNVDTVLICRGGGSFEDLMGFSESNVIKAIYNCPILTISAVGHEIDTMLSDYVADIRAPTPSVAGEIICKYQKYNIDELTEMLNESKIRKNMLFEKLEKYEKDINSYDNNYVSKFTNNIIDEQINDVLTIGKKSKDIVMQKISTYEHKIQKLKIECDSFNNSKLLKQGYCMIVDENYDMIKSKLEFDKKIKQNKKIKIIFNDGESEIV